MKLITKTRFLQEILKLFLDYTIFNRPQVYIQGLSVQTILFLKL